MKPHLRKLLPIKIPVLYAMVQGMDFTYCYHVVMHHSVKTVAKPLQIKNLPNVQHVGDQPSLTLKYFFKHLSSENETSEKKRISNTNKIEIHFSNMKL